MAYIQGMTASEVQKYVAARTVSTFVTVLPALLLFLSCINALEILLGHVRDFVTEESPTAFGMSQVPLDPYGATHGNPCHCERTGVWGS